MTTTLICICSKYPNPLLYECVTNLYKFQIKNEEGYKICIVDSDSDNFTEYDKVRENYPDVELHFIKNLNYEYGAWKYALDIYPNYSTYFCIQDSNIIKEYINLDAINDSTAYTFHHHSGFHGVSHLVDLGMLMLENSGLDFKPTFFTGYNLAQHSAFIVNNNVMNDIFKRLTIPPVNKEGSCCYERVFGLYFILKNINTIDLYNYMTKIHGKR